MDTITTRIYLGVRPAPIEKALNGGFESYTPNANELLNEDFEALDGPDDFSDWSQEEAGGSIEDEISEVYEGSHSVKITNPAAAYASIWQYFVPTIGLLYRMTTWMKGDYYHELDLGVNENLGYGYFEDWLMDDLYCVADSISGFAKLSPYAFNDIAYYDLCDIRVLPEAFANWVCAGAVSDTLEWPDLMERGIRTHTGDHAPTLLAIGSLVGSIAQTMAVTAGNHMTLSFWARGNYENAGIYILEDVTHSTLIIPATYAVTGDAWKEVSQNIVIPAGCASVKFTYYNLSGYPCFIDDFSLLDYGIPAWTLCTDVLQTPSPTWEYGMFGAGPDDLVAGTGIAAFFLDNSPSNSAGKSGYYSPDHEDAHANFNEGTPVKITLQRTGSAETTKFVGTIAAVRPSSGLFEYPSVEVEAHDWMSNLAGQELGEFAIKAEKTADDGLVEVLRNFPVQPDNTDFDVGTRTFPLMFNTDSPDDSMARFFQKMARNEQGFIYLEGDGTLVFENHDARGKVTTSSFTLDGIMTEFDMSYERADIFNYIQAQITPASIDAAATTQLWEMADMGTPEIKAGETLEFVARYTDPVSGEAISAIDVVNPIVDYEFGSVGDFVSDDLHSYLAQTNKAGANSMNVYLTNGHPYKTGYINDFTIKGRGYYIYDRLSVVSKNDESIRLRGKRLYLLQLNQIIDPVEAKEYTDVFRGAYSTPHFRLSRIKFLANQTTALANGAIAIEPSTRFTAIEDVTGVSYDFHVNRIRYTQDGPQLWVDILAQPFGYHGTWIWDSSHWDNDEDGKWSA